VKTLCNTSSLSWLVANDKSGRAEPNAAIFDRIFGVIDQYFDHEWTVIWPLDDL
jgi:hypothetical protein